MKRLKRILAVLLCVAMATGLVACGGGNNNAEPTPTPSQSGTTDPTPTTGAEDGTTTAKRTKDIYIGTWWVQYYDSSQQVVEDDPTYETNDLDKEGDDEKTLARKANSRKNAAMKLQNVRDIEAKYGIKFFWNNLTYTGVTESINTSVLAGTPDCDVYLVEAGMAIPAQMNGLALDLRTILPADHDIFTTQKNAAFLDLGDGKACIFYRQEAQQSVGSTYPLAFNVEMLEEYNLEDPRDLWERGEWTWDKFIEYCQIMTGDTDGDGQNDQYGYCGFEYETFEQLMLSNGGSIAVGTTEGLTSTAVGEALQLVSDMYNVYNICYPYDYEGTPSDSMRNQYAQGNIGFWPGAAWIAAGNKDYDYDGSVGVTLPFETAYVRWPVGPSGNAETNAGKNLTAGEFYIIPAGVEDPLTVFNVIYDMWNWYDGDTSIRDDKLSLNWWYKVTAGSTEYQEANFEVMKDCGEHSTFDIWNSVGISYDLQSLMRGEVTPAQFQETYKQQVQDALDSYY